MAQWFKDLALSPLWLRATAVVQVRSLARELWHAQRMAQKKQKNFMFYWKRLPLTQKNKCRYFSSHYLKISEIHASPRSL